MNVTHNIQSNDTATNGRKLFLQEILFANHCVSYVCVSEFEFWFVALPCDLGSAYCTKPVLCNSSLMHETLSFLFFEKIRDCISIYQAIWYLNARNRMKWWWVMNSHQEQLVHINASDCKLWIGRPPSSHSILWHESWQNDASWGSLCQYCDAEDFTPIMLKGTIALHPCHIMSWMSLRRIDLLRSVSYGSCISAVWCACVSSISDAHLMFQAISTFFKCFNVSMFSGCF